MKRICVYCGSAVGRRLAYLAAARQTGVALAQAGLTLVYGGGKVGLMGEVADAALEAGGRVVGVMPRDLVAREIAHAGLSDLHVVNSMHERKWRMAELADGFVSLPGGAGTLEEFFEQWTWAQLGFHDKPSALLNVDGYFDPLCDLVARMVDEGFLAAEYRRMLIVEPMIEAVLAACRAYQPPPPKWAAGAPKVAE